MKTIAILMAIAITFFLTETGSAQSSPDSLHTPYTKYFIIYNTWSQHSLLEKRYFFLIPRKSWRNRAILATVAWDGQKKHWAVVSLSLFKIKFSYKGTRIKQ
jgi:hypothetical protein